MARERYLRDNEESTIHANQIVPTTAKEKRANWWYHYKGKLIAGILLGAALISLVWSMLNNEHPDYTVTIATEYGIPSELIDDLETHFEKYADDRNGDGEVLVSVQHCVFNVNGTSSYQAEELQASFVRIATDATAGDSMIFFFDDVSYEYLAQQGGLEGFFEPVDDAGTDYYLWSDLKSLGSLELEKYTEAGEAAETVQAVLGQLKASVRSEDGDAFKNKKIVEYRQKSLELFERLKNDTPYTETDTAK